MRMKTREIILGSMKKLLKEKTIEKIRVQDIISDAGVSKATFYKYFKDKYDIAMAFYMDNLVSEQLLKNNEPDRRDRFIKLFTYMKENRFYLKRLLEIEGQNSFQMFLRNETMDSYLKEIADQYHYDDVSSLGLLADAYLAASNVIIKKWIEADCKTSVAEIADFILHLEKGIFTK